MNRLSNTQKQLGPFTIARWNKKWIEAKIIGGNEEDPENTIFLSAFGWALRIHIPMIIKRNKSDGWDYEGTEYGFTLTGGDGLCKGFEFLRIYYGKQFNGRKSKYKSWFLPWSQWRFVRMSYYNPDWSHFADEKIGKGLYDENQKIKEACPVSVFRIIDFDGEKVIATCRIEQREWKWGEGWFKWLSVFKKSFIRNYLDIYYDKETGTGKGSWKGGTIGESCEIQNGESPFNALTRFMEKEHYRKEGKYKMKLVEQLTINSVN